MTREEVFDAIRSAEDEFRVADFALGYLQVQSHREPTILRPENLEPRHIVRCLASLPGTYVVNLYARFEAALRDYWTSPSGMRRRTEPRAEALISSIGAHRNIDQTTLQDTHTVREYRNDLVHTGAPRVALSVEECRSFLAHFVSYLPMEW